MTIHTITVHASDGDHVVPLTTVVDRVWKAKGGEIYACGNVLFRRLGPLGNTYTPETEEWNVGAMIEQMQREIKELGL